LMYSKAWSGSPPTQPMLPCLLEQSTKFCSESETSFPVALKCCPSSEPVDEKAQSEVHWPWVLTGVT
jgi:hypothetical protein